MAVVLPDTKAAADAASNAAADMRFSVEQKKHAAATSHPDDKFRDNASSKPFVGGFDQLLGSKRTT